MGTSLRLTASGRAVHKSKNTPYLEMCIWTYISKIIWGVIGLRENRVKWGIKIDMSESRFRRRVHRDRIEQRDERP